MIAQQMLTSGLLMMRVRYLLLAARTQSNPISSKPSMPQYSARQFPQLPFAFSIFALLFSCSILAITEPGVMAQAPEARAQPLLPVLASKTFDLREPAEVGFEIKARSNGASWAKRGAEAAALLIEVDDAYNYNFLLWTGDKSFT